MRCSSQSENFVYKKVPENYKRKISQKSQEFMKKENIPYFELESALPKNYSKDGNTDYTDVIQNVLDNNNNVIFPNFPLLISTKALYIRSNSNLLFQKKSVLIVKEDKTAPKYFEKMSIKDRYDILRLYDVESVTLINPKVVGDRRKHYGSEGEWGAGISIKDSKNIKIYNADIKDTWGDGIFIGSEKGGVSENVYIYNTSIDYARRNGISLTSGINVFFENLLISNTLGTLPMCGIDIEPSSSGEYIKNININNVTTFNNQTGGIAINLNSFSTDNAQLKRTVDINIKNHLDDASSYALIYSINVDKKKFNPTGNILYKDATWINQAGDLFWKTDYSKDVNINLKNVRAKNEKDNSYKIINDKKF